MKTENTRSISGMVVLYKNCNYFFLAFNAWKVITPIFLRMWLNCPIFDKICLNNLLFQTAAVKEKQKQIGNKKVKATEGYRNTVNK